jgi:uncharacterized phage-associated protein
MNWYVNTRKIATGGDAMNVELRFDFQKTLAAITYIASRNISKLTTYKILKILFFADKYHLVRYGRTITGDKYSALPDGPVPSRVYDFFKQVVKKPFSDEGRKILSNLEVDKSEKYPILRAKVAFDAEELSRSDVAALDNAIEQVGNMGYTELKKFSHEIAAYNRAWKSKKFWQLSAPMKFEDFFEDDNGALEAAKAEMIENALLRKAFAERTTV